MDSVTAEWRASYQGCGAPANGASILAVMGLAIGHGEQVVLESDDEALLDELAAMLATDLDEI